MPVYCYRSKRGEKLSRVFGMGKAPKHIIEDGVRYDRDFRSEQVGIPATMGWPMEDYASGVAPQQAQELRDYLDKRGVPTDVSEDGNPIYRDARHRRRVLKARGIHDRNSFE